MKLPSLREALTRPLSPVESKLLALAVTAPLAVWFGFIGLSVGAAETVVKHHAFYVMWLAFGLFIVTLGQNRDGWLVCGDPVTRREASWAILLVAGFSWLIFNSEPFKAKVLNDELVLQSTAYNLHFFRDTGAMVRGYEVGGVFLPLGDYLDKRPIFYPFLVTMVHDLTGFRLANAFAVNSVLLVVLFVLVWWLARRLAGAKAGLLAVAVLGTLPLLGQVATGSGMELTNLVMILLSAALAVQYLERPGPARLSALVLALVLLCQSRYESAVVLSAGAVVIPLGWWREKRVVLAWPVVFAPLLLVPFALQHKVLANSPVLWELPSERTERFSLENVPSNLERAWNFLTSRDVNQSNSWYLTLVGAIGVVWLLLQLWRHRRTNVRDWRPPVIAAMAFGLGILANLALIMTYFWAGFDDPKAARFALPFCVLLAVLAAVALVRMDGSGWVTRAALMSACVYMLGVTQPRLSRHAYSQIGIGELEWMVRTVEAREPGPRIVITNQTTIIWLLHRTPSILIGRARAYQDRLVFQLQAGHFREILVTQELRPTTPDGHHQIIPEDVMPDNFHLETLVEKRFGTKITRISRLVAVESKPAGES